MHPDTRGALALYAAAAVADFATTYVALGLGGRELNPRVAEMLGRPLHPAAELLVFTLLAMLADLADRVGERGLGRSGCGSLPAALAALIRLSAALNNAEVILRLAP
ncbi:MAG: hypothetical protein QW407_06490 [Thermofilaceae archaeon]